MCAFKKKSFFYYKKRHNLYRILFLAVKPDPEVVLEDETALSVPDIAFAEEGMEGTTDDSSSEDE